MCSNMGLFTLRLDCATTQDVPYTSHHSRRTSQRGETNDRGHSRGVQASHQHHRGRRRGRTLGRHGRIRPSITKTSI